MWACPWGVPSADWNSLAPKIHKCTHCADRCDQPAPAARNGLALTTVESQQFQDTIQVPACVKACPADALRYGDREDMLQEARKRIAAKPDKYVDRIYGEKEAGGTTVLYLSAVPFDKLGFPEVGEKAYPAYSRTALHAVPPAVMAVGAVLGGTYAFLKRRAHLRASRYGGQPSPAFMSEGWWTRFVRVRTGWSRGCASSTICGGGIVAPEH
jgi:formate dehydrogenase iron-sulfur subunit